jgi:hypothetical protein
MSLVFQLLLAWNVITTVGLIIGAYKARKHLAETDIILDTHRRDIGERVDAVSQLALSLDTWKSSVSTEAAKRRPELTRRSMRG